MCNIFDKSLKISYDWRGMPVEFVRKIVYNKKSKQD